LEQVRIRVSLVLRGLVRERELLELALLELELELLEMALELLELAPMVLRFSLAQEQQRVTTQ
jgi:hypothetical protein